MKYDKGNGTEEDHPWNALSFGEWLFYMVGVGVVMGIIGLFLGL